MVQNSAIDETVFSVKMYAGKNIDKKLRALEKTHEALAEEMAKLKELILNARDHCKLMVTDYGDGVLSLEPLFCK